MTPRSLGKALMIALVVLVVSAGYIKMEDNQNTTAATAQANKEASARLKILVTKLKDEAHTRCVNQNAGYDSQRNVLIYLRSRQETVQAAPLTSAQQASFDAAVALVPQNEVCADLTTEGGK